MNETETTKRDEGTEVPATPCSAPGALVLHPASAVGEPLDFHQRPRESAKAYAAFRAYLEMGDKRSIVAVAARLEKPKSLLERWSRHHDWPGRVAAYYAHLGNVERQAIEGLARERAVEWMKVHEDQRIEEWKRRCTLLKLADEMIERWRENPRKMGTLEGIARILELATKLGRLASGMGTEESEGREMPAVRVEVSLALERVYGQAEGGQRGTEVIDVELAKNPNTETRNPKEIRSPKSESLRTATKPKSEC